MYGDTNGRSKDDACQNIGQEVHTEVEARKRYQYRGDKCKDPDRREKQENCRCRRKGRARMAGREGIVDGMRDDRIDTGLDVERTTTLGDIFHDEIAKKCREKERPKRRISDGTIRFKDKKNSCGEEPQDAKISSHCNQWHKKIARAIAHVLVYIVKDT